MKTVILAGGKGTRLAEVTHQIPKPMVEIGDKPILWHILQMYARHGFEEFVLALGYKGDEIKNYFSNFYALCNDVTVDLGQGKTIVHDRGSLSWRIHLVDTGLETMTGGRLKRLKEWIGNKTFMMTYGDGVSDVDISKVVAFHKTHGKLATVTAVHPPARFGELEIHEGKVLAFSEKNQAREGWINGGFFVLEPEVLNFIAGDETSWEREPLERLAQEGELMAYCHDGFWQPMDTLRERRYLDELWKAGAAPWKTWENREAQVRR